MQWRVKAGKREVHAGTESACWQYVREHDGKVDGVKLRIVPPNKPGQKAHAAHGRAKAAARR